MTHESHYYNLNNVPNDWNREDFVFVVQALESLSHPILLSLLDKFHIRFTGGNAPMDREDLIAALIDDTVHSELVVALRQLTTEL